MNVKCPPQANKLKWTAAPLRLQVLKNRPITVQRGGLWRCSKSSTWRTEAPSDSSLICGHNRMLTGTLLLRHVITSVPSNRFFYLFFNIMDFFSFHVTFLSHEGIQKYVLGDQLNRLSAIIVVITPCERPIRSRKLSRIRTGVYLNGRPPWE